VANSFFFTVAGNETTATTMAMVLYNLAMHPEQEARLEAEVDAFGRGRQPEHGDLHKASAGVPAAELCGARCRLAARSTHERPSYAGATLLGRLGAEAASPLTTLAVPVRGRRGQGDAAAVPARLPLRARGGAPAAGRRLCSAQGSHAAGAGRRRCTRSSYLLGCSAPRPGSPCSRGAARHTGTPHRGRPGLSAALPPSGGRRSRCMACTAARSGGATPARSGLRGSSPARPRQTPAARGPTCPLETGRAAVSAASMPCRCAGAGALACRERRRPAAAAARPAEFVAEPGTVRGVRRRSRSCWSRSTSGLGSGLSRARFSG
jgi:hypothetical protein